MNKFRRVFIANRGEIAVRIAQTLRSMGIVSIAPYVEADQSARHTRRVDQSVPVESYLDGPALIQAALDCGAEAIHPGYGFLSENAEFARQVAEAGLVFIGPSPDAIHKMGDKLVSKAFMKEAGLPMIPSWTGPLDQVEAGAAEVGFPLLVKAAAGGGGKGMRLVERPNQLQQAVERAQGEARKAFGDDRVFLERFLAEPRHIEVQILGDSHGNAYCFGERECSLQRRYQKIVEEAPSVAVTPQLRERLVAAGIQAVKALDYSGAGTVEFVLDQSGEFYFLEVNTRLQVEHPVTEMVYGVDLVALQVRVAQGEPIELDPKFLQPRGWAIETRIYAEDPASGFLPSTGTLNVFQEPQGPFLRLDTGYQQGDEVTIHFDPMLAKLIAFGASREEALGHLKAGLREFAILGVATNIPYLLRILEDPMFEEGAFHTQLLEAQPERFRQIPNPDLVALAAALLATSAQTKRTTRTGTEATTLTPWQMVGRWRQI